MPDYWDMVIKLPSDYQPYGESERGDCDCSCGCVFARYLPRNFDWLVCTNPDSPRRGLLTFEHQGCLAFCMRQKPIAQRAIEHLRTSRVPMTTSELATSLGVNRESLRVKLMQYRERGLVKKVGRAKWMAE